MKKQIIFFKILSTLSFALFIAIMNTSCLELLLAAGGSYGNGGTYGGSSASKGTVIYSETTELSWSENLIFPASYFSSFSSSSKIEITGYNTSDTYHTIKLYAQNSSWDSLTEGKLTNATISNSEIHPSIDNGAISYTVTSSDAEKLKNYGLVMHGFGYVVTQIKVYPNGSSSTGSSTSTTSSNTETTIYSTTTDLGTWSNFSVAPSNFSKAQQGTVLKITTSSSTVVSSPSYISLKLYDGTWQPLSSGQVAGGTKSSDTITPTSVSGTIAYTLTSEEASRLRSSGLILQGYGISVNRITISSSASSTSSSTTTTSSTTSSITVKSAPSFSKGTPAYTHGALSVSGSNLVDKSGKVYQLYGMSTHGLSWFPEYVNKTAFQNLRDTWNTNCVRLALYPGDYNGYCNGGNKESLKNTVYNGIDYATSLGMYVIVDWHIHNDKPSKYKSEAKTFFNEVSKIYSKYDNIIYEICNEPVGADWDTDIKPYAEEIIPVIRANDSNAIIIVGTNTWSQDIEDALDNPITRYKDIMYTFHFYADTHRDDMRLRVRNALQSGLPIFITEFGTCDASGNGGYNNYQTQLWFSLIEEYSLSHINWSICNKDETASAIKSSCTKTNGWALSDLTESGLLVYNHFRSLTK